jgi:hypothetical protein
MKKAPIMLSAKATREAFVQIEIMTDGEKDQTGMFIGKLFFIRNGRHRTSAAGGMRTGRGHIGDSFFLV